MNDDEKQINLIGYHGILLGKGVPSDNPLTKREVDEFLKLTKSSRDAEMFATGYLYGLTSPNNGSPIKAERLREAHQATLDYLGTIEYLVNNDE